MKKLMLIACLVCAFACQDPEEGAQSATTDSTAANGDKSTLNTPPGATTPDTSGGTSLDTSHPQ